MSGRHLCSHCNSNITPGPPFLHCTRVWNKRERCKSESMQVLRPSLQYHNTEEADTGICVNAKYHQEAAKEACGG